MFAPVGTVPTFWAKMPLEKFPRLASTLYSIACSWLQMQPLSKMTEEQYHPLDSLAFLTNRVGRLLSNDIRKRSGSAVEQLFSTHIGVLVDLWVKDGLRQQDLVASVVKDKGSIARALDNLEKQGIVIRITDEQDRRNKRIYLTQKGRNLKNLMLPHALESMEEALEGVSQEEIAVCKKVLRRMYKRLAQKATHPAPITIEKL